MGIMEMLIACGVSDKSDESDRSDACKADGCAEL